MKAKPWSFRVARRWLLAALLGTCYLSSAQINFVETPGSLFGEDEISLAEYEDVDGDNDLDALIVGINSEGRFSKLFINDGSGNFTEKAGMPFLGISSGAVAFADIDNDNDQDVLISGEADNVLRNTELYINDGVGNFTHKDDLNLEPMFYSTIKFTDMDFDGDMDLYLSGYSATGSTKLYLNNGSGGFTASINHGLPTLALGSVWFFDYDKDGDLDFFGTGRFSANPQANLMESYFIYRYMNTQVLERSQYGKSSVVDLDGDTYLDIFYTGSLRNGDKDARMYLNSQSRFFTQTSITEIEPVDWGDLEFYDFDGDNDLDLLVTGSNQLGLPSTKLYLNDGNAGFSNFVDIPFVQVSESTLEVADFNGDGLVDVILTGKTEDGTSMSKLYLNQAVINTPPTVSDLSITGVTEVGQEVSLLYTYYDAEGDLDESDYIWYRADDPFGANRTEIVGATEVTYVLTSLDEEKYLQVEIIPKDGVNEGIKVESSWIGPIEGKRPVIGVQGNLQKINPESNIPSIEDHTYFGEIPLRVGTGQRIFTISNVGSSVLEITDISVGGQHFSDFEVIGEFPQSVLPGEDFSFSVNFNPASLGEKEAKILIENSDLKSNPFTYNILGKGINNPPNFLSNGAFEFLENENNLQVDLDASNGEGDPADEDVTYTIIGGEDQDFFNIDPETGIVNFDFTPDFEVPMDFDLDNIYLLEVSADDGQTETSFTTQTIRIKILNFDEEPVAACVEPFEVYLDVNGNVELTPEDINNGSTDDSGEFSMVIEPSVFSFQDVGTHEVHLTITDGSSNTSVCGTSITVRDTISPTVLVRNISISLDETGKAFISAKDIDNGSNDISGIASLTLNKTSFSCSDLGDVEVLLTASDNNGNVNNAVSIVTVIDTIPPEIEVSDMMVYLDAHGKVDLHAEDFSHNSSDACGVVNLELERTEFDCTNVGKVPIKVTGVDVSGNTIEEVVTITVKDTISPVAKVQNIVVKLNEDGRASITPEDIDNGSSDNCSSVTILLDKTEFDCSQIGDNEVKLTVEDLSGNRSAEPAIVTVVDELGPLAQVKDLVLQLDEQGKISVMPKDFDNGSSDACGEITLSLDKNEFDCSNLGENTLLLTLMDANGNKTETDVQLFIEDKTPPVIYSEGRHVRDINSADCSYLVSGGEFDVRVEDNCGIQEVNLVNDYNNKATLEEAVFPIGVTIVNWTISDSGGNVSSFASEIRVSNTSPELSEIVAGETSFLADTPFQLWAEYKDENLKRAEWFFSSEGEEFELKFPGVISGSNVTGDFTLPSNVYKTKLVVEDDCGETAVTYLNYLSVYDPGGGFVTGSGWINLDDELKKSKPSMKANFSLNVKYRSGSNVNHQVQGNSSFHFKAEGLNFKSTSYEDKSLVISGDKAIFSGVGRVNGSGAHKFFMVATDGAFSESNREDGLRIQIMKDNSNEVLYDSNPFIAHNSGQGLALGGGSIVIHKNQGNPNGKDTARGSGLNGIANGKAKPTRAKEPGTTFFTGPPNHLLESENGLVISPNPIDGKAEILFRWRSQAKVNLTIFDFNGRELLSLFKGEIQSNRIYRVDFNGENLQPGVYFCRLSIDTGEVLDKQLMVK